MSNFIVVDNKIKSRVTSVKWVLTFSHRTIVSPVENPSYSLEEFRLKTIPELLNAEKLDNTELFDMIAEVVGKEDPRELVTSKGKETRRLAVVLEDLEGNKIGCTLFRETVDHLLPHLEDVREEPLIVVLQYFEASRWNGKTSVQSNFSISKVHVDLELEEVLGFKNRLLNIAPASTSRISQVTTQGAWSATDELNNGVVVVKTVEQTLNSKEFYKSCRKCSKKVETPIGDRFKVEVMVYDGTRSISLLLWDRETTQLYGKRADQVREEEDPMEAFVSSLKSKTPVKGTSNDMKCGFSSTNINDEEGQFSTNKFTRKTNKRQKI
ncbi:uncharacterized protein [Arachis hypogaea]|uniref:uncharacterized protein n=1 Tax=Arachis hypogaea TaxID=3818 RepID=UPI000DECB658